MTEIVIVPAWRRAPFLAATLRRLAIADRADAVERRIWIALDRRHDKATAQVAAAFRVAHGPHVRVLARTHPYRGNSFNVLHSYREAIGAGAELVHLVEEDVLVGSDYFAFHRAAHELMPNAMAVSAARNQNYASDPDPDPSALYSDSRYQSVAVSFRPGQLAPVLAHAVPAYFHDPIGYCRRHFPRTTIPTGNAEQDGLINRMAEWNGLRTVYPALPRAYHAGFVGYHRSGEKLTGTVEQQADRILAMGTEEMNAAAYSYPDHQVVDLDACPGLPTHMIAWP